MIRASHDGDFLGLCEGRSHYGYCYGGVDGEFHRVGDRNLVYYGGVERSVSREGWGCGFSRGDGGGEEGYFSGEIGYRLTKGLGSGRGRGYRMGAGDLLYGCGGD